jgi:succinate dehydrogenase/fumarate reductase flavoprotein subunit
MADTTDPGHWHETYDVVVVGSGAGGMSAGLVAATLGSRVLIVEKTLFYGGGCAVSGGVVWIPGNSQMPALNIMDSQAQARRYLRSVIGDRARWDLIDAFLAHGPEMLDFLHARTSVRLVPRLDAPDYYAEAEGAAAGGRMLDPAVYDGRRLGPLFEKLRPPLPSFLLFGGMMVNKTDISALLKSHKSLAALRHAGRLLLRYLRDRRSHPRGTRLVVGNALAAALLKATDDAGVALWNETTAVGLVRQDQRIGGVVLERGGRTLNVRALRGVVLAAGGAPGAPEFMRAHVPFPALHYSMAPATNSGDGIRLGIGAGGRLDDVNRDNAFWTPVSVMKQPNGEESRFAHLITDRQKPGLIAVNQLGRRFTNESASYHDFVAAMHAQHRITPTIPAYLICDARFIRRYGLGMVRPAPMPRRHFIKAGYLVRARTVADLATALGVPGDNLLKAVEANNRYARTGVDLDFGKGSSAYHRYLGDPDHAGPNPCIGPIDRPPFFAVRVYPGDIGTSLGLRTDAAGRVLDPEDRAIEGLYACGNDMNSIMAGTYPSGGITLGPAMTFGYLAARALAADDADESRGRNTSHAAAGRGDASVELVNSPDLA